MLFVNIEMSPTFISLSTAVCLVCYYECH